MKKILIKKNFNHNTKKIDFLKKIKKLKKIYTRCLSPLLSFENIWSFGGA